MLISIVYVVMDRALILVVFIRFQLSAHGGQLYKRISLESNLNLIIWPPSAIVLYILVGLGETQEYIYFIIIITHPLVSLVVTCRSILKEVGVRYLARPTLRFFFNKDWRDGAAFALTSTNA